MAYISDPLAQSRPSHHAHGWTFSTLVHILGVGAALALVAELELPPVPEPFRWEVSLVEPPAPPTPVKEPQPIVETVPAPSPITRKVMTPIPPMEQPAPQPVVQQASEVPLQESLDVVTQETTYNASIVARATPTAFTRQDTVMEREDAVPVRHAARVAQVITQETTHQEAVRNEAVLESQPVVQPIAAPTVQASQQIPAPTVVEHRPVKERVVRAYSKAQTDYGWLRDALWNRIEQLKRYPAQAKANQWEGKVVLEAVIRDDGALINLKVAESSGYAILDQEALTAVKKASPLSLKHPLGQPRITILVPISYKLDK